MKNEYKKFFDGITPRESDAELLKAVFARKGELMNNRQNNKKRISFGTIAVPAAAAALAVGVGFTAYHEANKGAVLDLTGGASSSVSINIDKDAGEKTAERIFKDYFTRQALKYNLSGTTASMADFSQYITPLDLTQTAEGLTMNIRGVMTDGVNVYIAYDYDFDDVGEAEGMPFDVDIYCDYSHIFLDNIKAEESGEGVYYCSFGDFVHSDSLVFNLKAVVGEKYVEITNKELREKMRGDGTAQLSDDGMTMYKTPDKDNVIKPLDMRFELPLTNKAPVYGAAECAPFRDIRFSPFGVVYYLDETSGVGESDFEMMTAELSDGTACGVCPVGMGLDNERAFSTFVYPVDIDEIVGISTENFDITVSDTGSTNSAFSQLLRGDGENSQTMSFTNDNNESVSVHVLGAAADSRRLYISCAAEDTGMGWKEMSALLENYSENKFTITSENGEWSDVRVYYHGPVAETGEGMYHFLLEAYKLDGDIGNESITLTYTIGENSGFNGSVGINLELSPAPEIKIEERVFDNDIIKGAVEVYASPFGLKLVPAEGTTISYDAPQEKYDNIATIKLRGGRSFKAWFDRITGEGADFIPVMPEQMVFDPEMIYSIEWFD